MGRAQYPARMWMLAGGGGLLAIMLIAGLIQAFRGSDTERQLDQDQEALAKAFPVNEFPVVPWTFKPAPGPRYDFPEKLAVHYGETFATEIALLDGGPAYLSVENIPGGQAIHSGRLDLKTGRPVGPATRLRDAGNSLKPSAVSPNGTVVIGVSPNRLLQIYDPRQETPRTVPELSPIDRRGLSNAWYDFAADERLWLLKDGSLAAWDLAAGQPTLTVSGGPFTPPAMMGPDRTWLLVQVDDKYLEIRDTATGECRGRFGGEGRWQTFAVSPDGRRLVGARYPGVGFGPGAGAYDFPLEIHEWDLATGERKSITPLVRKTSDARSIHFIGNDHLLVDQAVLDLARNMHIADVGVKPVNGYYLKGAGWTNDGRRWVVAQFGELVPVPVPLDQVAGEPAFKPGDALWVEPKCDDSAIDARIVAAMTGILEKYGFRIEEGGWTLRVSAKSEETKGMIGSTPIPEIKGTIELVAPDGTVTATSSHNRMFPAGPGSKYYVKSESQFDGQVSADLFDFGARSPAECMREEAWTHFIRSLPESPWPRAAWKSGDQYIQLPIKIEVEPQPTLDR